MNEKPAFIDHDRPNVPDITVPRGIVPFYLANSPVRGRIVRLGVLADTLLGRHDNMDVVSILSGKALALVAGLASALKFEGSFSLQIKGDGPVSLLLADATESGALRFYARANPDEVARILSMTPEPMDRTLTGEGFLAFTIDQGSHTDRHQGIVAINGPLLENMAEHYFTTSEQHDCKIMLACLRTEEGWRAGALILERIAGEGGLETNDNQADNDLQDPQDKWETALALAATLSTEELLDDNLPLETVLQRLFHSENLHVNRPRPLSYGCRCSRSRLQTVLEGFTTEDLDDMAEEGQIVMTCEFCNTGFSFPRDTIHARSSS